MKTRTPLKSFLQGLAGLAIACGHLIPDNAHAEVDTVLFDSSPNNRALWAFSGEGASQTSRYIAQRFFTGDRGTVSSVSVRLGVGDDDIESAPSGVLKFEIWDDETGTPKSKVADLGEVGDFSSLNLVTDPSDDGTLVTLKNPIFGLKPNSPYHIVLDFMDSGAFVRRSVLLDINSNPVEREAVRVLFVDDSEAPSPVRFKGFFTIENPPTPDGTYSSPLLEDFFRWHTPHGTKRVMMMTVTESIPTPEICDLQLSDDSISVVWDSVPFQRYILEYSESLEEGSWVELDDSVDSGGVETIFVDEDAARVAAKSGFYRVRLAN